MSRAFLAMLGVALVAMATLIQIVIDWYQSDAMGVAYPFRLKLLTLVVGILTFMALILSIISNSKRS